MTIAERMQSGLYGQANDHLSSIHEHMGRQTAALEKLVSDEFLEAESAETHWLRGNVVCDASGNGQVVLLNQVGSALELVSWFTAGGSASNGGVVFLNGGAPQQQSGVFEPQLGFWASAITQYAADKFHNGMIVPVNASVVVQFLNMGNAQQCFVNVFTKIAFIRKNKAYTSRPKGW